MRFRPSGIRAAVSVLALATVHFSPAAAQELTPRTYWPAPNGTQVVIVGYGFQTGDVITDPSLPIVGVDSRIHNGAAAYQRTLSLFGRTANLQFELPWVTGTTRGEYEGQPARADVQGFGDVSATLSVNLMGAPSMTREQFRAFRASPNPILAASLKIVAPTGEYDVDRLINIGTNRWAARGELGYVHPLGNRWVLESSLGAWIFEDNHEFIGRTREQRPIYAFDVSLIGRFKPGFWASVDLNYYFGGRTLIDGQESANLQRNSRLGATLVYPFPGIGALRASYSTGIATKSGGDYDIVALSWIFRLK